VLTEPQIERYARHVLLREVGGIGQERLLRASLGLFASTGAIGWAVTYAALAGVGRISLTPGLIVPPRGFGALLPPSSAGAPLEVALAPALAAFNPDVRLSLDPSRPAAELVLVDGAAPRPGVRLRAAGVSALVAPASTCDRCFDALLAPAEASPEADALAGSLGATILLSHLAAGAPLPEHALRAGPTGLETTGLAACPHDG
jgi:hypothetical protein